MKHWKRKSSGGACKEEEVRERLIIQQAADPDPDPPENGGTCECKVPAGCVAVLVGGDPDAEAEERVVVEVRALAQPRVRALLDMAAREFGYAHQGLLRIPCAAAELRRAVAADDSQGRCRSRSRR